MLSKLASQAAATPTLPAAVAYRAHGNPAGGGSKPAVRCVSSSDCPAQKQSHRNPDIPLSEMPACWTQSDGLPMYILPVCWDITGFTSCAVKHEHCLTRVLS